MFSTGTLNFIRIYPTVYLLHCGKKMRYRDWQESEGRDSRVETFELWLFDSVALPADTR